MNYKITMIENIIIKIIDKLFDKTLYENLKFDFCS